MVRPSRPWKIYVYLISSTSLQKENPLANSVRQIKIHCAKYKFAERTDNFLMQLLIQLIFGDLWDLDKLQTCAKGKIHLGIPFRVKGHPKDEKIATEQKSTKKRFDRASLWRVYVYLISSTSMQKENPLSNSLPRIKIGCAKYKFAEQSDIFLMLSLVQLMFGDLVANFVRQVKIKKLIKKIKRIKKLWLRSANLYFAQRIFIWRTEFGNGVSFYMDVELIK